MANTPPYTSDPTEPEVDPSKPFHGIVVCCTSIPPEQRTSIDRITADLGGIHKYDLTPDVTHLIVGDYNTPKYRHVAKERPDIVPMAAGWVDAVRRLWMEAADIDFAGLEQEWRLNTFESRGGLELAADSAQPRGRLLCCLTGFDEPAERQRLVDMIEAGGGAYTGDLTRKVTHLIVARPEGKKYTAARNWGVRTVSVEWLKDSVLRGMILEESSYDPAMLLDSRGCNGTWRVKLADPERDRRTSLGKRQREVAAAAQAAENEGKRKLRKTASMKMLSQQQNLWGDILGRPASADPSTAAAGTAGSMRSEVPTQPPNSSSMLHKNGAPGPGETTQQQPLGPSSEATVFSSCCFFVHGFSAPKTEVLIGAVSGLGGLVCHSLDEVVSTSGAQMAHRILIVPQSSRPESHPQVPETVDVVTEFFVEKCLHKKTFFDPGAHVLGRPFPAFPLPGFQRLTVCTAGFTGVDLHQVDKAVRQLGARYEERFTAQVSLLVCASLATVRRAKLDLALAWNVPVVSADWLWECVAAGHRVPVDKFMFPELRQGPPPVELSRSQAKSKAPKAGVLDITQEFLQQPKKTSLSEPKPLPNGKSRGPNTSDFTSDKDKSDGAKNQGASKQDHDANVASDEFDTAPAHQADAEETSSKTSHLAPVSELTSDVLNTSSSPKHSQPPRAPIQIEAQPQPPRKPLARVRSEVADSDATGEGDDEDYHENENTREDEHKAQDKEEPLLRKRRREAEKEAERAALAEKVHNLLDTDGGNNARGPGPPVGRRRRGITGRCVSNASACSTESGSGKEAGAGANVASFSLASVIGDSIEGEENVPPPPTQLGWDRKQETKLTIGEVSGMVNMDRDYQRVNSVAGSGPRMARQRRKKEF